MVTEKIVLSGRELTLAANAYSLIIYEDEFKGRNFLKDFNNILGADGEEPNIANHIRFTWTLAKTANPKLEGFKEFSSKTSLDDILLIVNTIVSLINETLGLTEDDSKNQTAAVQ